MTNLVLRNRNPLRVNKSWQAFNEFENLVDRFFNSYSGYNNNLSPTMPIELVERDNNLILNAILPWLQKENINIEVSEDKVSISGKYKSQDQDSKDLIYRSEFFEGEFERTINLPQKIDHQQAKADYKDGILTLTLPKSEKETSKIVKLSL